MKSIIKTNTKKLLLSVYISEAENKRLCEVAQRFGIEVKAVGKECGAQKLGYLLGFRGFTQTLGKEREVADSCIVFSGIPSGELNAVLSALREAGVVIPLKAVCTAYNQSWELADLVDELAKEHETMSGGGRNEKA